MKTIPLLNLCRRLIHLRLLQNHNWATAEIYLIRHYCTPPEPVRNYELGDFSKDLRPYLRHRKKTRINKYLQNQFHGQVPIIKCKDPKLNFYNGQKYEKFAPIPLASENWRGHKSVSDYFTIKIYPDGYSAKYGNLTKDFESTDLHPYIVDILKQHNIEAMSEIQELAIPKILTREHCLIAAETGCGKTFAYLLPIIHQILEWKKSEHNRTRQTNSPYVMIVTPNRELTDQIRDVVRWFKDLDIKSQKLVGGSINKKLANPVIDETDILVTTPIAIQKLEKAGIYSFHDIRHVVLDEADSLLDDSFNDFVHGFLSKLNIHSNVCPAGAQLTLVSATMPTSLPDILGDLIEVEKLQKITTKELHEIMPHVKQKFIRVLKSTKPAYLLQIVKEAYVTKSPIIVFCNHSDTATWVSTFLRESGVSNINLNGKMLLKHRKGKFKQFQDGEESVLVCTDVASRGLDTKHAKHILNYDFPAYIVEYIHRCGRTGRLGSNINGTVTNIISGKNEVINVQKIELAVRTNTPLENVNANVKRILKFRSASLAEKKLYLMV